MSYAKIGEWTSDLANLKESVKTGQLDLIKGQIGSFLGFVEAIADDEAGVVKKDGIRPTLPMTGMFAEPLEAHSPERASVLTATLARLKRCEPDHQAVAGSHSQIAYTFLRGELNFSDDQPLSRATSLNSIIKAIYWEIVMITVDPWVTLLESPVVAPAGLTPTREYLA